MTVPKLLLRQQDLICGVDQDGRLLTIRQLAAEGIPMPDLAGLDPDQTVTVTFWVLVSLEFQATEPVF